LEQSAAQGIEPVLLGNHFFRGRALADNRGARRLAACEVPSSRHGNCRGLPAVIAGWQTTHVVLPPIKVRLPALLQPVDISRNVLDRSGAAASIVEQ